MFWSFSDAVKDFHCIVLNVLTIAVSEMFLTRKVFFVVAFLAFFHSHFENFLLASCSSFGEFGVVIAVLF